jgi:hypothetical protein
MKLATSFKSRLAIPLVMLGLASTLNAAPSENAANHANPVKSLVKNGKNDVQGNLKTGQHIYYEGDALDISVQFARGGSLLAEGEADAHIVIFSFDGTTSSVPVPDDIGPVSRKFFSIDEIDTATLPEGQYQLALVLTIPGGDPLLVEDWYSGFRALLDTEAVYISDDVLEGDENQDGEWDEDADDDGIAGEEDDEEDEEEGTI